MVPNLLNKNKYVLHIRNLELYLELGLKLTKIHKVLQFESSWLAKSIGSNTTMRSKAKMILKKYFHKLSDDAIFGKHGKFENKY